MLLYLRIENFALIDRLELEFSAGLNVLTGETGAGKSIILDAIDIALGGKIQNTSIRQGKDKTTIEATFQGGLSLLNWLKEQEIEPLDDRDSIVCSRELANTNGTLRSRTRVNGVLVNRQSIAQLRERLVEITAQGQTVQLMIPVAQRDLLDLYGGESLLQQRKLVAAAYEVEREAAKALEIRRQSEQQRLQRLDLLTYQIKELEAAELTDGDELELLEQERDRLSHVVELQQLSYQINQILYQNDRDDPAVADLLGKADSMLIDMVNYDRELESISEMVRLALTQVVEAGHQINAYGDSLEADPERLSEVESRIRTLKQICRKYGPTLTDAVAYYQKLDGELAELTDRGQSIEELEQNQQKSYAHLIEVSAQLTKLRHKAAEKLEKQLIKELKPLAMEKVQFECRLSPAEPTAAGADLVEYYFSPNPGEKLQLLSATASGGEMSRFLLALKACFANAEQGASTLIFDEIDAGVSGKVAQAIATKLHQLSQTSQVLCVTHQPLVAAMADKHFRVDKHLIEDEDVRTVVRIAELDDRNRRRAELAELTGGHSANDAIAFAESLLDRAEEKKGVKSDR